MKRLIGKYKVLPIQIKASFWFLVCAFLQKGISVLTTPIFTRILTTSEYGQYSVFNSWLSVVTIFVSLNISLGVYTQGLVKFEEDRKVFASSLQGLSSCLVLLWTIVYLCFKDFWNNLFNLTTVQMLAMLLMIWTTAIFNFWASEQRVLLKYRMLVIITLIVSLAKPLLGYVLVVSSDDKVTARILGLAIVEFSCYSFLFCIQLKNGKCIFNSKYWRYVLSFNIPLIPHYLSFVVMDSTDRIMIKNMVGDSEAGIYGLAYSVASIMLLFNLALSQTISPWITKKIKMSKVNSIESIAYMSLIIVAVVNLLLIVLAPEIVTFFAPQEYYDAVWIIPPVAMSVYFMYSYNLFSNFAFYYEKKYFISVASVIAAAINLMLNYIFIKEYGYMVAGYTTLVSYIIYAACHYCFMNYICKKHCNNVKPYNTKVIIGISVLFVLFGFLLLFTYSMPIIRYIIVGLVVLLAIINKGYICNNINAIISIKKEH